MRTSRMLADAGQDLKTAFRNLLRAPMTAATIVLTVGLGIAGTTVIFGAVNATILRPLPYADAGQLVRIYTDAPPNRFRFSVADYLALQEQQTRFALIAGFTDRETSYADGAVAERLGAKAVTPGYFALLGIRPVIGRDFAASEGRPGSQPVVIVSHAFWSQRLHRRDAIGRPIRLDGVDHVVVGVLPEKTGPLERRSDVFVATQWNTPRRKGPFFVTVLARLPPGADRSLAAAELRDINRRIFAQWRASYQDEKATWAMLDLKAHVLGNVETIATLAVAAVVLVWAIACANASNLLIARVTSRRRELAVRLALGASRARLTRYLLAESVLLAGAAATTGIALARAGLEFLRVFGARYLPRVHEIALDGTVLWFLVAITAASVLIFGIVPAFHGSSAPLDEALRSAGRTSTGTPGVRRLRRALVAGQFAVATPLLVFAALLMASLTQLKRVDLGFDSHNLLTAGILLPAATYRDEAAVTTFWDAIERRSAALPGVSAVAFADSRPPNDANNRNNFDLEDAPTPPGASQPVTPWIAVTPGYFRLFGLALLEGRLFDERDGSGGPPVIIVDRAWAGRFFPNQSAVGKRLREGGCSTCPWTTVAGVVSTVKYAGLDSPDEGTVYWPMPERGADVLDARFRYLVLRTNTDPSSLVPALRQVVRAMDPELPLSRVATVDELVAGSLQLPRSLSLVTGMFAALALLLSVVGIYGVMTHYVQQHTKDISIRMALGGTRAAVVGRTLQQGMSVVIVGVAAGLVTALASRPIVSTLLFGVGAVDALILSGVAMLMLLAALLACWIPAARAAGVEPAAVLRLE